MTADRLFDPEPYTTGKPRAPRAARVVPDIPVEPIQPGWIYLRDRRGVIPYAHLIATKNTWGTSIARCGVVGTTITESGVDVMRRCQLCDADLQLS